MDAFEEIVSGLLGQNGFWTWQGYKINLTKDEKKTIGKPSIPRPEIDALAYSPGGNINLNPDPRIKVSENTLVWIECKSYLDSKGVSIGFSKRDPSKLAIGIHIFDDIEFREVVSSRLIHQLFERGLVTKKPTIKYGLVAGRIHSKTRDKVKQHFDQNDWILLDEKWINKELRKLADPTFGYENNVAVMAAKLMGRISVEVENEDKTEYDN